MGTERGAGDRPPSRLEGDSMLLIYKAPDGRTYQYEEGEQPEGYVLADVQPKGAKAPNKSRRAANKKAPAEKK